MTNVVAIKKLPMNAKERASAQAVAVARVESAAFSAGESRARLLSEVFTSCGAKPNLTLYNAVKLGAVVGFMASALARKGDNRTEQVLRSHCRDRIANYQGATGKGKLRNGQKGRRTQTEEDAYASARVLSSRLFGDAGVKVPEARGGDRSKTGKAGAAKGTNSPSAKAKAANDSKPAIRKFTSPERMVEYALIQGKAMQGTLNKSAGITPGRLGTAINAFLNEVLAVAGELGMSV